MSPQATNVGGLEVRVDGAPLDPSVADRLLDARVQDDLLLPDQFQLRFRDPDFELIDGSAMDVGKRVELRLGGPGGASGSSATRSLFTGTIATLAPEFEQGGAVFVVRGFDASHQLNLTRRSRTFQDMTIADIARKVITDAGLQADVAATTGVSAFEQQSNETDWNFLWRLAARCGFTVSCLDGKIALRPGARAEEDPVRLEWGAGLRAFHPRATAVQQVTEVEVSGWDPGTARRVSGSASQPRLDSSIGLERSQTANAGGGGRLVLSDRVVASQSEANELAQSTLDHLANAWLEAEGSADGDARLSAGAMIEVVGLGRRFSGRYLITGATHIVRGGAGYETRFRISGRARRTLLDLLTPAAPSGYAESLVIGQVTNVDDPQGQGRVRVKFPALDEDHEGWWARVAAVAATGGRGLMMMPLVGDEVVVGFEQGDERRPIVLGALWNGQSPPGDLVRNAGQSGGGGGRQAPDGSFNLVSEQAVTMESAKETAIKADSMKAEAKTIELEGQNDLKGKANGITLEGSNQVEIKGGRMTLHADGSLTVESSGTLKLSGASVQLQATGTVQISGAQVMLG